MYDTLHTGKNVIEHCLVEERSSDIPDSIPIEIRALLPNIEDRYLVPHAAERNDCMGANEAISSGQKYFHAAPSDARTTGRK
jgi:hypothetical protein